MEHYAKFAIKESVRDRLKVIAAKEGITMLALIERWVLFYEKMEKE